MKRIFSRFKEKLTFKELPPPYRESENAAIGQQRHQELRPPIEIPPCEVLDLLANCRISSQVENPESEVEYAEIEEMGLWHSTPLSHRHKSKISLTWVLKDNVDNPKVPSGNYGGFSIGSYDTEKKQRRKMERVEQYRKCKGDVTDRVVGRNEFYHNMRFRSACEEFVKSEDTWSDDTSVVTEETRRRHRHRHRRRKRNHSRFGYDIRDLDTFLSEASIDRPGNIPVVIAYPTTLYQTQKDLQRELGLPLGTVVNAVFKNQQWLYAQTPHGDEGYVLYNACLPLGILPNRSSPQKKTPCWESSTDIYPRPCGNLTDTEKEQLRGRTRSECRYRTRNETRRPKSHCAEKDFDSLYLRTKSVCSNIDKAHERARRTERQTLLLVNSDFKGSEVNRTLSVKQGDVVVLAKGRGVSDVEDDWFYVRKKDGSQGYIPAATAGHGYF